ncbi:TPR end-of-group domain-containing protein [Geothrix oryzisoli]|uniref:TPR end-of-group domain-containing protein n=1 Tax=Geothrix oryzisoli TaxID=2922721 RepID=UPI001FAD14CF|nr:tetratricopeptide repeat protein [Geothrix oryzisoli]
MALQLGKPPRTPKPAAADRPPIHPKARKGWAVVAVLPFLDHRPDGGDAHLGEGIADEVLQALNHLEGLQAVSRTTSFRYGGSALSPAAVGRHLHATAVLAGSLRKEDRLLTLKADLVDVKSGRVAWSKAYAFDRQDLFATLDDMIRCVASALHVPATIRPRYAVDLEAYECYLKGRQHYFRFNRHGMRSAAQLYRRSLDLDPSFPSAWAGLANCAAYTYIYIDRTEPQRELAESCSRKALELDPELAEAHASRGAALSAAGLVEEAEAAFETALRLDPNLFEAAYFYARHCLAAGKPERAIEYFEWAAALRPEDFQAILLVAQIYHSLGLEDEARRARRAGLSLVEERLEHAPDDVRARYLGANALVALGERDKGLAWARMARAQDPDDPMLLYNLGCIHALAGAPEESLDCLEQAAAGGLTQKDWFLHDGDLDGVRSHPRFQALMARLGS